MKEKNIRTYVGLPEDLFEYIENFDSDFGIYSSMSRKIVHLLYKGKKMVEWEEKALNNFVKLDTIERESTRHGVIIPFQ